MYPGTCGSGTMGKRPEAPEVGENSPLQRMHGPALWRMPVEFGTDTPHRLPGRGSPTFDDDPDVV